MSGYTNNGTYGAPFGQSGYYYPGMSQHQNVPVTRNPSSTGMYATGNYRESYMHAGYTTDPWSNYASSDASSAAYTEGSLQGGYYSHQTRVGGSSFNVSASGTTGAHMYSGMGVEANPSFNHSMSIAQSQPHSQHSVGWLQTSGSHGQSAWTHPEHTARRHSDERSSTSARGTRTEVSYHQPTGHQVSAGHRVTVPTGHLHPVNTPARSDPVPAPVTASPTRSRGEWWDPIDAPTSQCQWKRCGALIAGDRRSVTSHLRDRHGDFSSDGKTIQCEWAGCTASMQRRNIPRHILACHLEVKVPCPGCGMSLSRADASKKHRQACPKAMGGDEDESVY